jgi:hypothetical protein
MGKLTNKPKGSARRAELAGRASDGSSLADFKERIAIVMRKRETGKTYSVIGGPRADESVVRQQGGVK